MTRELGIEEHQMATTLCRSIRRHDSLNACPSCRAAILALVDGAREQGEYNCGIHGVGQVGCCPAAVWVTPRAKRSERSELAEEMFTRDTAPSGQGAGEAVVLEKVWRDTTTYKEMLAQNRYVANFGEQAKGIEGVVLPVGSTEAIARLLRDLVAWGFGMGQAEPESSELLSWHERAEAATAKIREHIASHAKTENLLCGLHKIVADLAPYFDKPLTEEALPRWLALDSAQKVIAQHFAALDTAMQSSTGEEKHDG